MKLRISGFSSDNAIRRWSRIVEGSFFFLSRPTRTTFTTTGQGIAGQRKGKGKGKGAGQQGSRAAGQQGSRAAGQQGSSAAGQQGSRAAGQQGSRAAGHKAAGQGQSRKTAKTTRLCAIEVATHGGGSLG